jgi:hypothetical protein
MISPRTNPDAFLKELNLGDLKGKEREDALASLEKRFNDVILNTVLGHLTDFQFEVFKKALTMEDPEKEIAIITSQIPGLAQLIEQRLLDEYALMKSVMA